GLHVGRGELERRGLGAIGLLAVDGAGFDHRVQHQVAAIEGAFRVPVRIQIARPLHHAGKQRGFRQSEALQVLVEVGARGFGKAADGERAALAQVHHVGVELKDLLLGELLVELDGDKDFGGLALQGLLAIKEEGARDLHGDGRAALAARAAFSVVAVSILEQPQEVHAPVLEEAPVLDGEHGVHQDFRYVLVLDELALGTLLGIQGGDKQRFQFVFANRLAVSLAQTNNALYLAVADAYNGAVLIVVGLRAGPDLDAALQQAVVAQRRFAFAHGGITGAAQLGRDLIGIRFLAYGNRSRARVDARGVAEQLPAQAAVNHALVADVIMSEDAQQQHRAGNEHGESRLDQRVGKAPARDFVAASRGRGCRFLTFRNSDFYGHSAFPQDSVAGGLMKGG